MRNSGLAYRAFLGAVVGGALLATPARTAAHDIPQSVLVRAFVKPDGDRLRMVMRVPLEAIRDVAWPVRGPGYLQIAAAESLLADAAEQWLLHYVRILENGEELGGGSVVAARLALPSDPSFVSYEVALAAVRNARLSEDTDIAWQQAMVDVLIEFPIASAGSRFSLDPEWAHLGVRTTTMLRFVPPDGAERVFQYAGDPGLVHLDPRWHQAALSFVALGFHHILQGADHLLFLLCLVVPFRRFLPLVAIVTSFTVAHSITLIAAATGFAPSALWFPPLIETLIAASILLMAFENIVGANLKRRWIVAFVFGLVHGFGFSFLLTESLQFAGGHMATSLLSFNVGVELGQVLVVALAAPALALLFRHVVPERIGVILVSALVAHTAWHWMVARGSSLAAYEYHWPAMDAAFVAGAMRLLMLGLILVGAVWMMSGLVDRIMRGGVPRDSSIAEGQ